MKKLLLMLLLFPLAFVSCSDDDDGKKNYTADDLLGNWEILSVKADKVETSSSELTQLIRTSLNDGFSAYAGYVYTYSEDGKYEVRNATGTFIEDGNFSVSGNRYTEGDSQGTMTGEMSISGSTLTYIFDMTQITKETWRDQGMSEEIIRMISKITMKMTLTRK